MDAPRDTELCVHCCRPVDPEYRPFCSERCKLLDLGDWLTERHRVPGDHTLSEDYSPDDDDRP